MAGRDVKGHYPVSACHSSLERFWCAAHKKPGIVVAFAGCKIVFSSSCDDNELSRLLRNWDLAGKVAFC